MAEIKKLVCDMCGRDIKDGYVFKPSSRRRIHGGTTTSGAYRFDLCDACLGQIQKACKARKEASGEGDDKEG